MSISSNENNFLIQRYLQEFRFDHPAFTFAYESKIFSNSISSRQIPPDALIYLLEKGFIFTKIESLTEENLDNPELFFGQHFALLKQSLHQILEHDESIHESKQRKKVFPTENQGEILVYFLSKFVGLFLKTHANLPTYSKIRGKYYSFNV
jgi:hypothetical protein